MDSNLTSARLVKLYQILYLQLNKFICELEPKYVISNFKDISESTAISLEKAINHNIRYLIPTTKNCIDKLLCDLNVPKILKDLETQEINYRCLENFESDPEAIKLLNDVFTGKGLNLSQSISTLQKFKEEGMKELDNLIEENRSLEEKKQHLYSEVYHKRVNFLKNL